MGRPRKDRRNAVKVKCGGEAHSNAFIDNCMVCAPNWGHFYCCPACTATLDQRKMVCRNPECVSTGRQFGKP